MNYKKRIIIATIIMFIICFPLHFVYDLIPCSITAIFTPVNESIWEHMKLILTSSSLYYILNYIYINIKKNEIPHNYFLATSLTPILSIGLYLIIFLPVYYNIGENMIISIGLLFIILIFAAYIHHKITKKKAIPLSNIFGVVLIIITYIIFGYLTYNPPTTDLFFDTKNEKYGINIYNM